MKPSRTNNNKQNKQGFAQKPKPDIRDDMDSRGQKEQNFKDGNNKSGKAAKKSK